MLIDNVRHAVRVARAHPAFAAGVVFIMAVAIGANTAVFAVLNAVILSPLPFQDSSRLVEVNGRRGELDRDPLSLPDFRDLRDGARSFEALAASFQWSA